MAENSLIEWCNHTFNPWWGCTKVSAGCTNCYADALDHRTGGGHWGPTGDRRLTKDWSGPRRWDRAAMESCRPHRVFCASMADVFDDHRSILPEWRDRLWDLIRETQHLDWLLLTKRPENIATMLPPDWGAGWDNVWLGASVEDQTTADERIPHLLDVPAAKRFLSCEPLLGPVDLEKPIAGLPRNYWNYWIENFNPIDWVIVGGESGPKARPMHPDWARDLRDQCYDTGTAFFFKQWGEWSPTGEAARERLVCRCGWSGVWGGAGKASCVAHANECQEITDSNGNPSIIVMRRVGKKVAGRLLDAREWNEVPE